MDQYQIQPANDHDFCLLCRGKADKKLVGKERTFRFCKECGMAFMKLLVQAFWKDVYATGFLDKAISRDEDLDPVYEEDDF